MTNSWYLGLFSVGSVTGLLGFLIRVVYERVFDIRDFQLGTRELTDRFYWHLAKSVRVNGRVDILNFSNRPIGSGATASIVFNDDETMPHRGLYFELEEALITKDTNNLRLFVKLNRQHFGFLRRLIVRFHICKTIRTFSLHRTFSVVSPVSYETLKKSASSSDEAKRHLKALQERHVSIFRHLTRVQNSTSYGVTAVRTRAYLPNPTTVLISEYKRRGLRWRGTTYWGFLTTLDQMLEEIPDLSLRFRHTRVKRAFEQLVARYQNESPDVVRIKNLNEPLLDFGPLIRMNPQMVEDIRHEIATVVSRDAFQQIAAALDVGNGHDVSNV